MSMSSKILMALVLTFVIASDPAFAEVRHGEAPPAFTAAEQVIIHRNAALLALVGRDPWLVRRVLDAIETTATSRSSVMVEGRENQRREPAPDPARNPDLDQLGRASPEAAHDLFQLIKQAGKK